MWFVILLVAVAIFYLAVVIKRNRGTNETSNQDRPNSLSEFERQAEYWKVNALEKSPLGLDFTREIEKVKAMENDYLRLKERFKHDNVKVRQIAEDWYDYCYSVHEIKVSRELLDVSNSEDPFDEFEERAKEYFIKVQEIEKRFEKELGKEAHITFVNKQYEKQEK